MKKTIIPILSLLVLTLFSCEGNQTQNQNKENTTPADTTAVETTAEPAAAVVEEVNENVAEELFKKQYPEYKDVYYRDSFFASGGSEPEDCEGCYSGEELACYPLKDGGYLVAFTHVFGGPGCSGEYDYWTQIYKDGVLTDVKDVLPIPELDDLLNPSKTENYKNDIAEFRAMFEKSPMGFIYYEFQPPMSLSVRLYPWDCEEAYYNMDKVMLSPYNDDKVPEYKWDGVKFVKQ
jgi:hypothetical protein